MSVASESAAQGCDDAEKSSVPTDRLHKYTSK